MECKAQEKYENKCQLFETVDLEKQIELSRKVYDESQNKDILGYYCHALVLRSLDKDDVDERCIEALESLLMFMHPWLNEDEGQYFWACYTLERIVQQEVNQIGKLAFSISWQPRRSTSSLWWMYGFCLQNGSFQEENRKF